MVEGHNRGQVHPSIYDQRPDTSAFCVLFIFGNEKQTGGKGTQEAWHGSLQM